ncbi:PREDICTED: transmembrane protein 254, partial [Apaloderma vittatum]
WLVLSPATIPYNYMPAVGDFLLYAVKNYHTLITYAFWGSLLIHVVEAFYCISLCEAKGITDSSAQFQWFIQTLLFGYASFGILVCYQPPAKKYY